MTLTNGIDLATSGGHELYSMCNGTLITKEYDGDGFGNYIIIKSVDGTGFLYAHMADPSPLSVGDIVKIGDYVGREGTTGSSTRNTPPPRDARLI